MFILIFHRELIYIKGNGWFRRNRVIRSHICDSALLCTYCITLCVSDCSSLYCVNWCKLKYDVYGIFRKIWYERFTFLVIFTWYLRTYRESIWEKKDCELKSLDHNFLNRWFLISVFWIQIARKLSLLLNFGRLG